MAIYEISAKELRRIEESDFNSSGLKERADLQRLLRTQIEAIAEDLYVLAEEFSEWDESKRRIDLLALHANANLVVVELKRNNDGSYMDLQSVRYAAMVSKMTFERTVQIHGDFLRSMGKDPDKAQSMILEFLDWPEVDEESFAADTRIILVAADFGKELTTSVMWLNDHNLDITCIRIKPYRDGHRTLIDVQQIIPLPEASDYQIQMREKKTQERKHRAERFDLRFQFWEELIERSKEKKGLHAHIKPRSYSWIGASSGFRGLSWNLAVKKDATQVELYIDRGNQDENKAIFDQLAAHQGEIDAISPIELVWQRLDDRRACRIKSVIQGGFRSPRGNWPKIQTEMVEKVSQLQSILQPFLQKVVGG